MGTSQKTDNLKVKTLEVTDKIIFSGNAPVIQIKANNGPNNPLKIQILDRDDIATHEFIVNDSGAGDIRHNGKVRRIV